MEKKSVIVAAVILLLIVAGMFIFAYIKKSEIENAPLDSVPPTAEEPQDPYSYIDRIDAKHFFIDGTHTLTGEIQMPTPCDLVDPKVIIAESFPEQVTVDFTVINNSDTCAEVITPQRFKVKFDANENASIGALLNGRQIDLNLIPPAEGETPDEFELFIKG